MPDIGGIAGERLRSFIERIERLEEEKRALSGDIKEVFAEAKGNGFDTKIMRQLIRIRRMDKDDLDEQETLLDVYKRALGMLPEQPASARRIKRRRWESRRKAGIPSSASVKRHRRSRPSPGTSISPRRETGLT